MKPQPCARFWKAILLRRPAFTLVEMMFVLAIISILASMLVPALRKAQDAARRTKCLNNIKQILISIQTYANDNDHLLPTIESDKQYKQFGLLQGLQLNGSFTCPSSTANDRGQGWPTWYGTNINGTTYYTDYKINDRADIAGAKMDSLPHPEWVAMALDIDTWLGTPYVDRHGKGLNIGFLDGHVELMDRERFWNPLTAYDPYGHSPWYNWGGWW